MYIIVGTKFLQGGFAGVVGHVADFKIQTEILTAKFLKQGYRYHKLRKAFAKFYRRHYDLVSNLM